MARPDVSEQRTEQILDAYGRCVARWGIEGTSLQQVADEAGVHKSILRHYVGSKQDLVDALTARSLDRYRDQFRSIGDEPGSDLRLNRLVDLFFPETVDAHESALIDSVTRYADEYPNAFTAVYRFLEEVLAVLTEELKAVYPHSAPEQREVVAEGIWGLSVGADVLRPYDPEAIARLRQSAGLMVSTLERGQ